MRTAVTTAPSRRVVDQVRAGYGSNSSAGVLDEYKYGYNLQGDVAYRQNVTAGSADLDQAFTDDQQHDLTLLTQGQVNTATDLIMSGTQDFFQSWTPDGNGNWTTFSQGPSSNNLTLVQQPHARLAYERDWRHQATPSGPAKWVQPAYDGGQPGPGNMTTTPQPGNETAGLTCTYNAWNWLVTVVGTGINRTVRL